MSWFLSWYFLISLLGWLVFPIVWQLFPALPSRGYAFSRTIGLLLWGYIFWLCTSLGVSQNDLSGLLFGLLVLALFAWRASQHTSEILLWLKSNLRLIVHVEGLFLLSFAFLAFVRASNPELTSAEKPMELMFINSILRSPTFPPRDGWLSGYAISYYHFGYIMTAMLAKLTATPGSAAHNLMTALIFGLSAVGAYGLLYDLLARQQIPNENDTSPITNYGLRITKYAFYAPLFLLLVSNVEGFLELLHRRGLFWTWDPNGNATSSFWTWLDVRDLNQPPLQPLGGPPERYLWWWRASRIVQDYDLSGNFNEIIDEFPFFSFLHADLHPHVLAIPFSLLAMGIALHIFYGGWRARTDLFGFTLHLSKIGLLFTALALGGLAFLNTWDILIAATLVLGAYLLARVAEVSAASATGWNWERVEEALALGLPLVVLSVVLYLPFYIGFSSQLGGILPNLVYPTRGAHLWVMFGTLWLPLFAFLLWVWQSQTADNQRVGARWKPALGLALGLTLLLWGLSWLLGWGISLAFPETGALFLQGQNMPDLATLFQAATQKRLDSLGGLLTLLALLTASLALLPREQRQSDLENSQPAIAPSPVTFTLLLVSLGALLVIGPEFLYLRDLFGTRINTIFKFYYQAWIVWSIAAAFGIVSLSENVRGIRAGFFYLALALLLVVGLAYPYYGLQNRTGNFRLEQAWSLLHEIRISESASLRQDAWQSLGNLWTLDYFDYVERSNPDEAKSLRWLQTAPDGVVAEAIGGSYSEYGRVSAYTGLPAVLGWPFHEYQWRGSFSIQGAREADIKTLYATPDWQTAKDILDRYHIRYVYVGDLERANPLQEEKFSRYLQLAFQSGNVTIYDVP